MTYRPDDDTESATGRRLLLNGLTDVELGRLLRSALEDDDADALVSVGDLRDPTTVDGRFSLPRVAARFLDLVRATPGDLDAPADRTFPDKGERLLVANNSPGHYILSVLKADS